MKTIIAKPGITVVTIITVVTLLTLSAHAARTVARYYRPQPHAETITFAPGNYDDVMNNLFGR
ncbi:MAG: hypothetical protein A2X58_14835 [Nitrospirae bacterium GWC2_56_14]|nr:MAG: hypothetical protein A2X58_14835 [Nitrospirae bacterium GWC2_56_14]